MSEHTRTGLKCPVCQKEIMVDDILDMAFIAKAKSQPDLLEACNLALAIHYPDSDLEHSPLSQKCKRMLKTAIAKASNG